MKQCVVPTVKHGVGIVLMWGCFGGNNIGDIVNTGGIKKVTKEVYSGIFKNHGIPSGSQIIGEPFFKKITQAYLKTL